MYSDTGISSHSNEIAFVFDTLQIDKSWYGLPVIAAILPLLNKKSTNSILVGDYIGDNQMKDKLHTAFIKNIIPVKQIDYQQHSQFYIVYINNLTNEMVNTLNNGLKDINPYVGYFDLSYSSFIKTYISTILVRLFLKNKTIIIQGHEDDRNNDENYNVSGYPFEDNGYVCKSIQSLYYSLFLSYKIERQVFDGFQSDTTFSINAITDIVFDIADFKIDLEERKMAYLLKTKADNLERAGISNLTITEIEKLIEKKISSNYIYNLTFLKDYGTFKFDILIETIRTDSNKPFKLIVALEYKPMDKTLRLITMF